MALGPAYPIISGGLPGVFTNVTVTSSTIPTNGIYLPAANTVGVATNGVLRAQYSTTAYSVALNTIIGSTSVAPDGTLHVYAGSAGTVTAAAAANVLVIEDDTDNGLSILTPDASNSNIYLGSPTLNRGAFLRWNYNANAAYLVTDRVGATLGLYAGASVLNLTLSGAAGSELATFAGDVTLSEGKLTVTDTANETALTITSSATSADPVYLNGNLVQSGNAILIQANALTNGTLATFTSSSANASARSLVRLASSSSSATGTVILQLEQGAANAFMNLVGTAGANVTDPISTFVTVPGALAGWMQWDVNGAKRWIPFYNDPVS